MEAGTRPRARTVDDRLPPQAARGRDTDAADPRRRLLPADACRPRRAVRHRAHAAARGHGQPRARVRARPAARDADLALRRCRRDPVRLRSVVPLHGSERQRDHRSGLSGDLDLRCLVLRGGGPGRGDARHRCRRPPQFLPRLPGRRRLDRRPGAPELRHGADPHPDLHAVAGLAAGRRVAGRAVDIRRHAGHRALDLVHGLHRTPHPVLDAGGAERALHPHRPRQGPAPAAGGVRPRAQAGDAAGDLLPRSGLRRHDHRLGGDRRCWSLR